LTYFFLIKNKKILPGRIWGPSKKEGKEKLVLLGKTEMIGSRTCPRHNVEAYRSGTVLESNQFPQSLFEFLNELL